MKKSATRRIKNRFAFALTELLWSVGAISIFSTVAVVAMTHQTKNVEALKLMQEVKSLNSSLQTYEISGGSLDGVTTPQDALAKLKTRPTSIQRQQAAGLSQSLVDHRLNAVPMSAEEASTSTPRAVWNSVTKRFVVANSGFGGIKEFAIDESAMVNTEVVEERKLSTEFATADSWVWDYTDQDTSASGAGGDSATSTSGDIGDVPTTADTDVSTAIAQLAAPTFTVPGGDYPYIEFVELQIEIENPNPPTASPAMYYNLDGGPWQLYTGPFTITDGTYIRAYAQSGDPLAYSDSPESTQNYGVIWQTFTGGTRGAFTSATGGEDMVVTVGRDGGNNGHGNNWDQVDSTNPNTVEFEDPSGLIDDEIGYGNSAGDAWITWGTPSSNSDVASSLIFAGDDFRNIDAETLFNIGSLEFTNGTGISGTEIWGTNLAIGIDFSTPDIQERFDFNLGITTTSDSGSTAAVNADSVYIDTVASVFQTRLNGIDYALQLQFGSFSGADGFATNNEFHVYEGSTATAEVYGIFVAVENIDPLP